MVFNYAGVKIFYKKTGKAYPCPTLLLHGWECQGNIFDSILKSFEKRNFITLDFPPFGKSGKNIEGWNIFTYVNMVISLCEHLGIKQCHVVGHSFGGRVAVLLSALRPGLVKSLVLVDAAGLKPKRKMNYYFRVWKHKLCKKLGIIEKNAGSENYRALPATLKKVFVEIVNQHLDEYCHLIVAPTLIIFGGKDVETPPYMAKRFKRYIDGSKLVILDDAGHFCFLDCPLAFVRSLYEFWEGV